MSNRGYISCIKASHLIREIDIWIFPAANSGVTRLPASVVLSGAHLASPFLQSSRRSPRALRHPAPLLFGFSDLSVVVGEIVLGGVQRPSLSCRPQGLLHDRPKVSGTPRKICSVRGGGSAGIWRNMSSLWIFRYGSRTALELRFVEWVVVPIHFATPLREPAGSKSNPVASVKGHHESNSPMRPTESLECASP